MEEVLESAAITAAEVYAASILQHDPIIATIPGLDFPDPVDVDEMRAVHAYEGPACEPSLQCDERLPPRIGDTLRIHHHRVPICLDSVDVQDIEDVFPVEFAHDKTLGRKSA